MSDFTHMLLGRDLRSIARSNEVAESIRSQKDFDRLFELMLHHERLLVMRAADAVEKVTREYKEYLQPHKRQLLSIASNASNKELKWHIAQLLPRLELTAEERQQVWHFLSYWAKNPNESKIARVNALQGLFELAQAEPIFKDAFLKLTQELSKESVPSIQARIRKLTKAFSKD